MNASEIHSALIQIIEEKTQSAASNNRFVYATVNNALLLVRVKDIRFVGDEILVFDGHDANRNEYTVIQHISQLNMCISEKPLPQRGGKVVVFRKKQTGNMK